MEDLHLSEADLRFIKSLNIRKNQVQQQIELFRKSSCYMRLSKPCTIGDGIRRVTSDEIARYLQIHQEAAAAGRFVKFVPASGAATRMFEALCRFYNQSTPITREDVVQKAKAGDCAASDLLQFVDSLKHFALFDDLRSAMARDGLDVEAAIQQGQLREVLGYVLSETGLNCEALPKGLLKFHRYSSRCRTAFEEHLVEAAHYVRDRHGRCRVHFTVSVEHYENFRTLVRKVVPIYEDTLGVRFDLEFSHQKKSLDTIAVDMQNRPFRDETGRIVFRPAGHGALIDNLNELSADFIYIKNIDNVVLDEHKEATHLWKKTLGGMLVHTATQIQNYVAQLCSGRNSAVIDEALNYARGELLIHFPEEFDSWPNDHKRDLLTERLNRPVRICGVVQNVGEPGGAPFWTLDSQGSLTPQIVEKAQVDMDSHEQQQIWLSSTHFNPVDIVCAIRDFEGKPFDLTSYVDHNAVFITTKSNAGRSLKALELPGLWNGAMSDWITLFVEVPRSTFNPVKKINDLLNPGHRREEC